MQSECDAGQNKAGSCHELDSLGPQEAATSAAVLFMATKAPDVCIQISQACHCNVQWAQILLDVSQ